MPRLPTKRWNEPGSGSGWRPLRPSPMGPDRSRSAFAWNAPGVCPLEYSRTPLSMSARSKRQSTTTQLGASRGWDVVSQETKVGWTSPATASPTPALDLSGPLGVDDDLEGRRLQGVALELVGARHDHDVGLGGAFAVAQRGGLHGAGGAGASVAARVGVLVDDADGVSQDDDRLRRGDVARDAGTRGDSEVHDGAGRLDRGDLEG